jgi:hypothetical protein
MTVDIYVTNWGENNEELIPILLKAKAYRSNTEARQRMQICPTLVTVLKEYEKEVIKAIEENGGEVHGEIRFRNFVTDLFNSLHQNQEFVLPDWFGHLANSKLILKSPKKSRSSKTTHSAIKIKPTQSDQKELIDDVPVRRKASQGSTTHKATKKASGRGSSGSSPKVGRS